MDACVKINCRMKYPHPLIPDPVRSDAWRGSLILALSKSYVGCFKFSFYYQQDKMDSPYIYVLVFVTISFVHRLNVEGRTTISPGKTYILLSFHPLPDSLVKLSLVKWFLNVGHWITCVLVLPLKSWETNTVLFLCLRGFLIKRKMVSDHSSGQSHSRSIVRNWLS